MGLFPIFQVMKTGYHPFELLSFLSFELFFRLRFDRFSSSSSSCSISPSSKPFARNGISERFITASTFEFYRFFMISFHRHFDIWSCLGESSSGFVYFQERISEYFPGGPHRTNCSVKSKYASDSVCGLKEGLTVKLVKYRRDVNIYELSASES